MRSLAQELAIEERREKARTEGPPPSGLPVRTYIPFDRPRSVDGWKVDGQVVKGYEANGLALPQRVLETLGQPGPAEYTVLGETRYDDGRWYLDFAVNAVRVIWASGGGYRAVPGERYPVVACPDCDGLRGDHVRIEIPDRDGGRPMFVKCPRDTKRSWKS